MRWPVGSRRTLTTLSRRREGRIRFALAHLRERSAANGSLQ
jgi:hypothetical protein